MSSYTYQGSADGPQTLLLTGDGPPDYQLGNEGDCYIDTTNLVFYGPKDADVWPIPGANITGPPGTVGATGATGAAGAPGAAGADGKTLLNGSGSPANSLGDDGDFYLDTSAEVLWGPKSGNWPSSGVSLVGPQGPQGPAGAQGNAGAPGSVIYSGSGAPS